MPWERIYYKSLKVAYLKTQCRRHWMNEGTVSRGVALRPRPTEVQPCFLGSNIYYLEFFYIFEVSRLHIDFCYHIIIFIYIWSVTFEYRFLLPYKQSLFSSNIIKAKKCTLYITHLNLKLVFKQFFLALIHKKNIF